MRRRNAIRSGGARGAAAQVIFAQDNFAGSAATALTSSTPEVGGAWVQSGGFSGVMLLDGSSGVYNTVASGVYYSNTVPPSADYYVESVLSFVTNDGAGNFTGDAGRIDTATGTGYTAFYRGSIGWYIGKTDSSTLSGPGGATFTSGTKTVRLVMVGTSISLYVNGVLTVGPITNSTYTAAGKAGLYTFDIQTGIIGYHQTAFVAAG